MYRRLNLLVCLLLGLLSAQAAAKKDKPSIGTTKFEAIPVGLTYFEDSDVILLYDKEARIAYQSSDAGANWKAIDGPKEKGGVLEISKHPNDNQLAVLVGHQKTHWITRDQGKTWDEFETEKPATPATAAISFHATDSDRMIFHAADCVGLLCTTQAYYTTDGFRKEVKLLNEHAISCQWAKSNVLFTSGDEDIDNDRILCHVRGKFSGFALNSRLVISDDFFRDDEFEPKLEQDRSIPGIVSVASTKGYLIVAAKSEGSREMAMYVSQDSKSWQRAAFGTEHKLEEDAYTLLESTNYSMQVDVMTTKFMMPAMGVLYTSNSNGTEFTKNIDHTNRNSYGFVDFEKIQNIQGIVMVNVVHNWEEVEISPVAIKELKTSISFDDGRTFQSLQADEKDLHLHLITDQRNIGRILSSPAPGIVMGVGNTGKYLKPREECDLYVSDDAGLTWTRALSGDHLYEFGDQGAMLVAVDAGETDEVRYSINHGKDWSKVKLDDKVRPIALTTTPDSTSLKFVMSADKGKGKNTEHLLLSLDFTDLHERKCEKKDFEDWNARVDEKGDPICIMGHTQVFRRRKADAECFVDEEFKDPIPLTEDCKCAEEDYECDFGFVRNEKGECKPSGPLKAPEGACKEGEKTFEGPSGYRLIPGNTCVKRGGVDKEEPVERECGDTKGPKASGEISSEITAFKGDSIVDYFYLERCETCNGDDETVIMRTNRKEVYLTSDHGKNWVPILEDENIVAIYPHQYDNDRVYMVTPSKKVFYSENRGKDIHHFETPEEPNTEHLQILSFHPNQPDWLIWTGDRDCDKYGDNCNAIAHASTRHGADWKTLAKSVRKCQFVYREDRPDSDELVYCEQHRGEGAKEPLDLISSTDWFEHSTTLKRDVVNFATMAEYIVVATHDKEQKSLQVDASIDGVKFADAVFPRNFQLESQQAYTVLDSSTHAIFLHVTVNNKMDSEYGSIIKSNSNGTSYIMSINEVNRNEPGYVDFEKMQGLEGVALVNVVANAEDAGNSGKKLKTKITHNDGADWALIARPETPPNGKVDWCDGSIDKCSLHLHGYTERDDPRDTYSSPSAVGLMVAVGNVGEFLGHKNEADTFVTRDAGVTWHMVAPGSWMWEYGDQGSIVVIVKKGEPVKEVLYSLDEGKEWYPYEFSKDPMLVDDITTVPSDTSRNFLLWGKLKGGLTTVNLDFSGLKERSKQCFLDEEDPEGDKSDYYLWSPKHPLSDDNCLFGHVAQYHRKKVDRDCYNGREIQHLHDIAQNCTCTRRDFECDYNYERMEDGSCKLVPGLEKADPSEICRKDKNAIEYYNVTGYRRIPLTTCQGGLELDLTSRPIPCSGHEEEFQKKHGISGVGLFFAIVVPIAAAAGVGFWVYKNWDGKFGRIQLGDGGATGSRIGMGGALDRDAPWVKYPVLVISGVVAVLAAVPMVVGSVWRSLSTRFGRGGGGRYGGVGRPYTSRSSFSRGRGGYAVVDEEDEGELLGEDSEDEA